MTGQGRQLNGPRSYAPAGWDAGGGGGGETGNPIGLFFREFEEMWSDSISREDRRIDTTLPVIMFISNYLELNDNAVLRYYDPEEIKYAACQIYDLTSRLPASPIALDKTLSEGELLGMPVSNYLHIFDYHEDDDLHFRKSVCFVHWFMESFPHFAEHMRQCLTGRQLQRLGLR
jgi:hypothetical protein